MDILFKKFGIKFRNLKMKMNFRMLARNKCIKIKILKKMKQTFYSKEIKNLDLVKQLN